METVKLKVEELSLTTAVSLWEPIEPKDYSVSHDTLSHSRTLTIHFYIFFFGGGVHLAKTL